VQNIVFNIKLYVSFQKSPISGCVHVWVCVWDRDIEGEITRKKASARVCSDASAPQHGFTCVTWRIHTCDMTHSHVRHDAFTRVTWRIHTCDVTHSHVWHDAFTRVTWRIHIWDMTHSHVWRDAFTRVTWRIHTCDMIHSHVWHDAFTRVTRCIHIWHAWRLSTLEI